MTKSANNGKPSQTKCWKCWKSNGTPYGCSWFKAGILPKGATGVNKQYIWYGVLNSKTGKRPMGVDKVISITFCPEFEEETEEKRAILREWRKKKAVSFSYEVLRFKIKE